MGNCAVLALFEVGQGRLGLCLASFQRSRKMGKGMEFAFPILWPQGCWAGGSRAWWCPALGWHLVWGGPGVGCVPLLAPMLAQPLLFPPCCQERGLQPRAATSKANQGCVWCFCRRQLCAKRAGACLLCKRNGPSSAVFSRGSGLSAWSSGINWSRVGTVPFIAPRWRFSGGL